MLTEMFFDSSIKKIKDNLFFLENTAEFENQQQTNEAFDRKWKYVENVESKNKAFKFQKDWYLNLYGFENEETLSSYLKSKEVVLDAGCGLGYKAKWFADLSPETIVIGMDSSDAVHIAADNYRDVKNLFFVRGDIANNYLYDRVIDYVSCDQVLQHTENPDHTVKELVRVLKNNGELAIYVYARKAFPRELVDDFFRNKCKEMTHAEILALAEQLTELGKTLRQLDITIDVPDIPALEITGGRYNLQRFFYWNFLKCFWNEDLGWDLSVATNYDWYSPSNAKRYSEKEFRDLLKKYDLNLIYFHKEKACYSGRASITR